MADGRLISEASDRILPLLSADPLLFPLAEAFLYWG
jgi:hypothetical protein